MQQMQQASRPMNTMAVISLATGIGSWFLLPFVGGVIAIVTGHVAKSQIRRTGEDGDTLATIGLVLGYLHLAVVLVVFAFLMLVLFGVFAFVVTSSGIHPATPSPLPTG
jgi:uncharacterized membrane protein